MALSKAKLAEGIKDEVGTLDLNPSFRTWMGHDPLGKGVNNADEHFIAIDCPVIGAINLHLHLKDKQIQVGIQEYLIQSLLVTDYFHAPLS